MPEYMRVYPPDPGKAPFSTGCYLCAVLGLLGLPQCFGFGGHFIAAWPDTCLSRYSGFNMCAYVYIYNLIVFHTHLIGAM